MLYLIIIEITVVFWKKRKIRIWRKWSTSTTKGTLSVHYIGDL